MGGEGCWLLAAAWRLLRDCVFSDRAWIAPPISAPKHVVDEAVLLDAAAPREGLGGDGRAEVVAAAGVVLDLRAARPGIAASMRCLMSSAEGMSPSVEDRAAAPAGPPGLSAILWKVLRTHRSETMITITDKGAEKVHEFLAAQEADVSLAGLRVGVRGGGCSGFQYQLAFDEQRDSDVVFESHGLKLLVDSESLPFVRGSTIDYEESLQGAGFKVNNPNVVAACGCGSSFRVAEEEQVSAV